MSTKVWLDITSIRQANLLATLIYELHPDVEVVVTTSRNPSLARVLYGNQVNFSQFNGSHNGSSSTHSYGHRILELTDFIKRREPDLLISDLDPSAVRTAFGLGMPVWTFFREAANSVQSNVQRMTLPLCEKIFVSQDFPDERLVSMGLVRDQIHNFKGWNECYLLEEPWASMRNSQREDTSRVLLRSREQTERAWIQKVTQMLKQDVGEVMTRIESEQEPGPSTGAQVSVNPPPLIHDLYVGSGRMAAEFFVLGKPLVLLPHQRYGDLQAMYSQVLETRDEHTLRDQVCSLLDAGRRRKIRRKISRVMRSMESPVSVASRLLG